MARTLKILVVVMGLLLIGGTVALVLTIIARAHHPKPASGPGIEQAASPAPPSGRGAPYQTAIAIPPGAQLTGVESAGPRAVLRLTLADGSQRLLVLDLGTGEVAGTIDLRADAR